jgi:hypothetical protein
MRKVFPAALSEMGFAFVVNPVVPVSPVFPVDCNGGRREAHAGDSNKNKNAAHHAAYVTEHVFFLPIIQHTEILILSDKQKLSFSKR